MIPSMLPGLKPVDLDAERAVLGAALHDAGAATVVAECRAELFELEGHREVVRGIQRLIARSAAVDEGTLRAELEGAGAWHPARSPQMLAGLIEAGTVPTLLPEYLARVRELATRRDLMRLTHETHVAAADLTRPLPEVLGGHVTSCVALEEVYAPETILSPVEFAAELAGGTEIPRLATGLSAFDVEGGLPVGDLTVLAGRPGMGKTQLAVQVSEHVAFRTGLPILFISAEMTRRQIGLRLLSRGRSLAHLRESGFYVSDPTAPTITGVCGLMRRAVVQAAVALIVVDHLGKVRSARSHERREQEVAEVAEGLRNAAKSLDVPVLALCQMNRGIERRNSPRPILADLRDSGAVEQEAALVCFAWSSEDRPEGKDPLPVTLTLAKSRHGATGERPYWFFKARGEFVESTREEAA